eukprot:2338094-Pleurochrysis_carterae.AAC.1
MEQEWMGLHGSDEDDQKQTGFITKPARMPTTERGRKAVRAQRGTARLVRQASDSRSCGSNATGSSHPSLSPTCHASVGTSSVSVSVPTSV